MGRHEGLFVGPCSAKKLEAMRKSVRSEVDFVLTFEEMSGMMDAKGIDYPKLKDDKAQLRQFKNRFCTFLNLTVRPKKRCKTVSVPYIRK